MVGVIWAAVLLGFGAGVAYRNSRGSLPRSVEVTRGGDGKHRLLVVANETVEGEALLEEIRGRCRGRDCEILVVTPALADVAGVALGLGHRRSDRAGPPADGALADRDQASWA